MALLLLPLAFALSQSAPPAPEVGSAGTQLNLARLLDANGDGVVDRYEAAEAAMAWVDGARREAGAKTQAGVSLNALVAYASDEARKEKAEGGDAVAPEAPVILEESVTPEEIDEWFQDLDGDGNRYLDAKELEGDFERQSWRLFDGSADQLLDRTEFNGAARAAETPAVFEIRGNQAKLRGIIDASTPGRFLEVLLAHPEVSELVLEFVPGSMDDEANFRVSRLLHASGMQTRIPRGGMVASGGADLFLAGKQRIVEPGALVGVHSWAGDDVTGASLPRDDSAHSFYLDHYAAIGIDAAFYWFTLAAAPADGVHWMNEEEIYRFGLRTEAETLELLDTGSRASLRGLAGVSNEIAWATGSAATVLRTIDGGRSFTNVAPDSIAGLDVRDVHAISEDVAWILTAGPGEASRILHTEDGGKSWTEQHRETSPQAFLDGLDAWDVNTLVAYGDPMEDGRFRVLLTEDGGKTWAVSETGPLALESGEASFAASGTGVRTHGDLRAWIVTGGTQDRARVFWSENRGAGWTAAPTPVASGTAGSGIFSLSMIDDGRGVVVGGDFLRREVGGSGNAAFTADFGKTWSAPESGPRGQRAGSTALPNGWFLATGQTGTDISRDGGKTWRAFSSEGFHCVDSSLIDGAVWFAGPRGRVARLR